jgi:hypothetical protein
MHWPKVVLSAFLLVFARNLATTNTTARSANPDQRISHTNRETPMHARAGTRRASGRSQRIRATATGCAAAVICAVATADAQAVDYPTKPVRIIVPYGPGGVGDLTMRLLADQLSTELKQQFVIENRPGAAMLPEQACHSDTTKSKKMPSPARVLPQPRPETKSRLAACRTARYDRTIVFAADGIRRKAHLGYKAARD